MTDANSNGIDHIRSAVEIASAIAALPAVPTHDWCSRAAAGLRLFRADSIAATTLASVGARGSILVLEDAGVSGTDPMGRNLDPDALRAGDAPSFDWWIPAGQTASTSAVALLRDLPCFGHWPDTRSGKRWSAMGVCDLVVGVARLSNDPAGRSIVIEIGAKGPPVFDHAAVALMSAALPLLARRAMLAFGVDRGAAPHRLTWCEQQVLEHLALGKSVKQIASDLSRSPHTVHDHVKSLHRKLHASSRGELIARALGHLPSADGRNALNDLNVEFKGAESGAAGKQSAARA